MPIEMLQALLIPFMGTVLGAGCVFFIRGNLHWKVERAFTGFAAGVMVAASIWSLIIPAMEQSKAMDRLAFLPALVGFWFGVLFILLLDHIIPHLHRESKESEGMSSSLSRTVKLVLAVTLHNIPEGMAVGVVYAGLLSQMVSGITQTGALALALGIAIISLPLRAEGVSNGKAFLYGSLSGIVEPIGTFLTIMAVSYVVPFLPYFQGFAAGTMLYVVVEELIPEMSQGQHSDIGALAFAMGFSLMMVLDVALG